MTEGNGGTMSCTNKCWLAGGIIGLLIAWALWARADYSVLLALVIGIAVALLGGWVMAHFFCANGATVSGTDTVKPSEMAVAKPVATAATSVKDVATKVSSEVEDTAKAATTTVKKTTAKTATAVKKTAAKAKPAVKKTAAKVAAPVIKGADKVIEGAPALYSKAPAGGGDDLKQIKGVGPKLEGLLHTLGVYTFEQVASWKAKDVAWVDENLEGFNGRIKRDNWVTQAKKLAKG